MYVYTYLRKVSKINLFSVECVVVWNDWNLWIGTSKNAEQGAGSRDSEHGAVIGTKSHNKSISAGTPK